jgi:hypothetical protein
MEETGTVPLRHHSALPVWNGKHVTEHPLSTIEKKKDMSTYQTHVDDRPTVHTQRSRRATDHGQLPSARPGRLDRSIQQVPARAQAPSDPYKTAQPAAEVVGIRLLAVLTVAMFVTSIIGLTIFSKGGYSTTAIVSGVIGMLSAILAFIVGFHNAYRATR